MGIVGSLAPVSHHSVCGDFYSARALDDHQRWMITPSNSISSKR
jgi:hypothetical protein